MYFVFLVRGQAGLTVPWMAVPFALALQRWRRPRAGLLVVQLAVGRPDIRLVKVMIFFWTECLFSGSCPRGIMLLCPEASSVYMGVTGV